MNNQNSVGVVLLLLLGFAAVGGASGGGAAAFGAPDLGTGASSLYPATRPPVRPPVRPPHPAALAKDFHRMVGIMGKVDGLGQMALNPPTPPSSSKIPNLSNSQKAAEPESLINAPALPDLSGIMNMLAPIMSSLGASQGE